MIFRTSHVIYISNSILSRFKNLQDYLANKVASARVKVERCCIITQKNWNMQWQCYFGAIEDIINS